MTSMIGEPAATASTWRGPELRRVNDWTHRLTPDEVADLEHALAFAKATGKPMSELTRGDFPLALLDSVVAEWMQALQHGRGFINVQGIPVESHSDEDVALIHWGLGLHMGTAVSQNAAGDLLGHVRDTGADPEDTSVRLYKTRVALGFHSDGADLIALLCIRQGRSGGENRLVSTSALYNEILRRRPDLVPLLYEPSYWDRNHEQSEGEDPFFRLPICRHADGRLTFFYIPWYIRKAQRHPQVPRLTAEQIELLDLIDEIAADPAFYVEMRLEPGEINYLKNNAVLHARTQYVDWDEPERKRHLVRLWLIAHEEWADGDAFVQQGIPKKAGVVSDAEDIVRASARGAGSGATGRRRAEAADALRQQVKEGYTRVAESFDDDARANEQARRIGYDDEQLAALPEGANLGVGCGNPTAIDALRPGETVVDLGSGAGMDAFLAARQVGLTGHVIGVDMTPAMLEKARANARKVGAENVEFREGRIEELPLEDESVDVILSNCVINLSPEKQRVYREAHRVLRPGGRLMVSDIVLERPLPAVVVESLDATLGCVGGASLRDEYLETIHKAGFAEVRVESEASFVDSAVLDDPAIRDLMGQLGISPEAAREYAASITSLHVFARKPERGL